jgi:hypothetical protein
MSTARKYTIELDNRDLKEVGNLILGLEATELNFADEIFLDLLRQIQNQADVREQERNHMLDTICGPK